MKNTAAKYNVGDIVYVLIGGYGIENGEVVFKRHIEKFTVLKVYNYKIPKYEIKNDRSFCYLEEYRLFASHNEAQSRMSIPPAPKILHGCKKWYNE